MTLSIYRQKVLELARNELHVQADEGKRYDSAGRIKEYIESVVHNKEVKYIGSEFKEGHHWCAGFASWLYLQLGLAFEDQYDNLALLHPDGIGHFSCALLIQDMTRRGFWYDSRYDPQPGDLIFLAWDRFDLTLGEDEELKLKDAMKHVRHVGIVESYDGEEVIGTIEGNWKNGVNRARRFLSKGRVIGFGCPLDQFD